MMNSRTMTHDEIVSLARQVFGFKDEPRYGYVVPHDTHPYVTFFILKQERGAQWYTEDEIMRNQYHPEPEFVGWRNKRGPGAWLYRVIGRMLHRDRLYRMGQYPQWRPHPMFDEVNVLLQEHTIGGQCVTMGYNPEFGVLAIRREEMSSSGPAT